MASNSISTDQLLQISSKVGEVMRVLAALHTIAHSLPLDSADDFENAEALQECVMRLSRDCYLTLDDSRVMLGGVRCARFDEETAHE